MLWLSFAFGFTAACTIISVCLIKLGRKAAKEVAKKMEILPKLEDGELISTESGIFIVCPTCSMHVPQLVPGPDGKPFTPIDMRYCIQGYTNTETGESVILEQCPVCGMAPEWPLEDKNIR